MRWAWALGIAALAAAAQAPAQEEDWAALARADVQAAYDAFVANHPGWHDPDNPGFRAQLGRAREAGLRVAAAAADRAGYADALGAFSSELQDGHALAAATPPSAPQPQEWPGFVAAWRGKQLLVHQSPGGAPPVGAEILSCDGMPAREVISKRLRYRGMRIAEAGAWWAWSPRAFASSPSSQAGRPRRCLFRSPQGDKSLDLAWAAAPADYPALLRAASSGERTPIGLTEPRPGVFLIGLPDFNPDEAGVKAYRALFEAIDTRHGDLAAARAVVLDLRHNNGGSSSWSLQTAQGLWGKDIVDARTFDYGKGAAVWWRASPGNTAYLDELVAKLRADGEAAFAEEMEKVRVGMKAALAKGELFFVEHSAPPPTAPPQKGAARSFTTPVYVITPGGCASACLDAIDVFKLFGNVRLIGAPTVADTTYMDVRVEDLPSGRGKLVIPNKVYSGRPRGSGIVYRPDIEMNRLDWSTAAFLDRIELDLAARR